MYRCRLWSLSAPPPPHTLPSPPPAPPLLLLLPPPPAPPSPILPCAARWLSSLGNCLRALPAWSVIGRWHGAAPLPDPASCTDYCLLMFSVYTLPSSLRHPLTHTHTPPAPFALVARQLIQASCLSGISLAQSRTAQTCCSGNVFWEARRYEGIRAHRVERHQRQVDRFRVCLP